ncbi:DnaJ-domain-containing protein [Corynespora cassiicola Philippines]|uniref:DnaJ-domain-containing protein n=1 Tax=Corynespora cassiicola Philippines TaxID=1448308 RepID=A0A2T2P724_CORCC|nr:DnaJ-domain-containing protein [Corynespora cassiicola Philippines]
MGKSGRKEKELRDPEFLDDEENVGEEDGPPSIDPYAVLGITQEATADEVKSAYKKLALKNHPDKVPETDKEAANQCFQEIAFAYAVLSDDRRRKRFDLTGSTAEVLEDDDEFDWLKFYRQQFEDVVTQENIDRIANEYKGSDEERQALIDAYERYKGKLDSMYQTIMLSDILEDDDRFRMIINEEIAKGTIKSCSNWEQENDDEQREKAKDAERKRREDFDKRHAQKEESAKANGKAKAKAKSKKKDAGGMGDLAALIQQRQKARSGNFFDHLEARYAPTSRGKKRATPMEEPPEEMFQAAAERHKKLKQGRARKSKDEEDMDVESDDLGEEEEEEEEALPKTKKRGKLQRGRKAKA